MDDEQCTLCGDTVGDNDENLCDQCYEDLDFPNTQGEVYCNDKNPNKC